MKTLLPPPQTLERIAILRKRPGITWEETGISNPGALRLPDSSIALVYRGCGSNNVRHLGFCRLDKEGRKVLKGTRNPRPLDIRSEAAKKEFPGGYGDPRLTRAGEWYYIWANARNNDQMKTNRGAYANDFNGQYMGGRQTVAFRTKDFKDMEYLGLHGPDEFDKNSFLHPDPVIIEGAPYWAFFHRIQYTIQVALAPSLDFLKEREPWRKHIAHLQDFIMMRPELPWEGVGSGDNWPGSISGGTPPLEIESDKLPTRYDPSRKYWLMFYNASGDAREGKIARDRRVGAVIFTTKDHLDLESQPFKVVARTAEPVLLPIEKYELNSPNGEVVFATAAVKTLDNKAVDLFYASGDVIISKARFDLQDLVNYIVQFDEHANPIRSLRKS